MIEIAVGSKNKTKLRAVEQASSELWLEAPKITGIETKSGVSDQPMTDEEMIMGAHNRARNMMSRVPSASYTIGMEGGIRVMPEGWFDMGWVCVIDVATHKTSYGVTPAVAVPEDVRHMMQHSGLELSDAVEAVYKTDTIESRDCSGVITNGIMPADRLYSLGVLAAFSVLIQPEIETS